MARRTPSPKTPLPSTTAVEPNSPTMLVRSKLAPPHVPLSLLAREQLSALLQIGLAKRLVSITAPAGYGKTTALTQFVARAEGLGVATAWLSLDAEDNDPLRFMRYLAEALHHADDTLGRNALAQFGAGTLASLDAVVTSLLQDLAAGTRPLLVVFDDFHLVGSDLVHRKLEWLLAHATPGVSFIVASRTRLPLSVSQLRVRDELLELDAAHFGLRLDEAAEFIGRVSGTALERSQIETLHDRTEGWIAGLQLASLALRDSEDKAAFLTAFSGTDRDITDYLGEQVLDRLRPDLREFLLGTAMLDRFCAELCDEVLDRNDSRALLAEVQARNLFLAGLDRSRTWFRYHHLFADYLRTRMREQSAERTRTICLRASAWFDRNGLPHEAVRYAFEGRDLERAADLVAQFSGELVQHRGEHATLLHWIARLPPALVQARPQIRIGHAWSLVLTRRYPEADRELLLLEAHAAGATDDPVRRVVEMIRCVYFALTDQPALAKARSEAWLQQTPRGDDFAVGVVANVLAFGCCATDDFERGVQALALARTSFEPSAAHYGIAWAGALQMMIAIRRGDYHAALAEARRGIAEVERSLGVSSYAASMPLLLAAEVCYEHHELEQAQRLLDLGLPFVDEHGLVEMTAAGYLTRARLLRLRGETAGADTCLLEGESLGHRLGLPRLSRVLAAERCALRLQAGAVDDALKLAQSYGLLRHDAGWRGTALEAEPDAVVLVTLRLLHAVDAARANGALSDALRRAQRDGHEAQRVRLLLLRAAQQHRALDAGPALRTLDEALHAGARCGLVRSFVDGDPLIPELVEQIHGRRGPLVPATHNPVPQDYLETLLRAAGRTIAPAAATPVRATDAARPLVEPLTERELKILRLLDAGLGNRELAASLFLAEATVKWHLHRIFAKLGVKNRTSALARAREIPLL